MSNKVNLNKTELSKSVEQQFNEAVEMSADVTEALLLKEGWTILEELHKATFASVISTSLVMIPAMQNRDTILDKVSDPVAFSNNLETASSEISELVKSVQLLNNGHFDKKGSADLNDIELVSELTLGYSKIQTCMETAVQPLLLAMVEHMQEAGIDTEAVFLNTEKEGDDNVNV